MSEKRNSYTKEKAQLLESLLEQGKKKGFIRAETIRKRFARYKPSESEKEEIFSAFEGAGINVIYDDSSAEHTLTVRRSLSYNSSRHKMEIGPTKRSKVRTIDFGDTLTGILKRAREEQLKAEREFGSYYRRNYYTKVNDNGRIHYELYTFDAVDILSPEYTSIDLVSRQADGRFIHPQVLIKQCRIIGETLEGLEGFHFHRLRHTYTSNLLSLGATPKEVQELLGHSDVNMTVNIRNRNTNTFTDKAA